MAFIDEHRATHWVEPICAELQIAPSTYCEVVRQRRDPSTRSERAQTDEAVCEQIRRVWAQSRELYAARKVHRQLGREGVEVARCTVERLMRTMGIKGVVRGPSLRTTMPDELAHRPADRVRRNFTA